MSTHDDTSPTLRAVALRPHGLEPVSFDVAAGECVAVLGPSGSGKTVLLRALADLDPADGRVFVKAAERGTMSGPQWRRAVRYAAAEPGWWAETPRQHLPDAPRVAHLAEALGLATSLFDQSLSRLSTGERQRFAFVRAVVDKPSVLLLDEPSSSLDPQATERVEAMIRACLADGAAILLTSHDGAQVDRLADRRLEIHAGRLSEVGP